jgi:hypothetical protein
MSYSRRLENVLEQIETVENNLNKNLMHEFSDIIIVIYQSQFYYKKMEIMLIFTF